jgi:hypothetical protein
VVGEIRELGRATQGVTLIALDAGEKLAGLEKVVETEDDADLGSRPRVRIAQPDELPDAAGRRPRTSE